MRRAFVQAFALVFLAIHCAFGQLQYSKLVSFSPAGEFGVYPTTLIEGTNGVLFGTTLFGGTNHGGVIFTVNKDGSAFQVLHHFDPRQSKYSYSLIQASDGKLYGTLYGDFFASSDAGLVFRLNTDGTGYTVLYVFAGRHYYNDPGNPSRLLEGTNGVLYGLADQGSIFRLNKDGSGYQIMHDFVYPASGNLVLGRDGALYGTGPSGNYGEIFKINQDGSGFAVIYLFTSATEQSQISLEGSDGALYGSFYNTFENPYAGLFKINKDGSGFTLLQQFSGIPLGTTSYSSGVSVFASVNSMLYGWDYLAVGPVGTGTVFRVSENGTGYAVLRQTVDGPGVGNLITTMFKSSNGLFYGATSDGGATRTGSLFCMNLDGTGYITTHSFADPDSAGQFPSAVVTGTDGMLYGVTGSGGVISTVGPSTNGTFFRLKRDGGGFQILSTIGNGLMAYYEGAPLTEGSDGAFYLMASSAILRMTEDGISPRIVHSFSGPEGDSPVAPLLLGSDGLLYGCALRGGTNDLGTVFRLNNDGSSFEVLYEFKSTDGIGYPSSGLIEGKDGVLYGACAMNGVYRLQKSGAGFSVLASTGESVWLTSLLQATNGVLYGTTSYAGSYGAGTVFTLNTNGTGYRVIHQFGGTNGDGFYPQGLVQGPDGTLYGTTSWGGSYQGGTVFRITLDGIGYRSVHDFDPSGADGQNALGLTRDASGALYGSTKFGGESGFGTVFVLQPQPVILPPWLSGGGITLEFQTAPGSTNQIQFASELGTNWLTVTNIVAPLNGECFFSDSLRGGSMGFYRVIRLNP